MLHRQYMKLADTKIKKKKKKKHKQVIMNKSDKSSH